MVELSQQQLRQLTPQSSVRYNQAIESLRNFQAQELQAQELQAQELQAQELQAQELQAQEPKYSGNELINKAILAGLEGKDINIYGLRGKNLKKVRRIIRGIKEKGASEEIKRIENIQQRSLGQSLRDEVNRVYLTGDFPITDKAVQEFYSKFTLPQDRTQTITSQTQQTFSPEQARVLSLLSPSTAQSSYQNLLAGAQPVSRLPQQDMSYYDRAKGVFVSSYKYLDKPLPDTFKETVKQFGDNPVGTTARGFVDLSKNAAKAFGEIYQSGQQAISEISELGQKGLLQLGEDLPESAGTIKTKFKLLAPVVGFAGKNILYFTPAGLIVAGIGQAASAKGDIPQILTGVATAVTGGLFSTGVRSYNLLGAGLGTAVGGGTTVLSSNQLKQYTEERRLLEIEKRDLRLGIRGSDNPEFIQQAQERIAILNPAIEEYKKAETELTKGVVAGSVGTVVGAGFTGGLFGSSLNKQFKAQRFGLDIKYLDNLEASQPGSIEYAQARLGAVQNVIKNEGILFTDLSNLNTRFPSALDIARQQNVNARVGFNRQMSDLGVGNTFLEIGVSKGTDVKQGFDFVGVGSQDVKPIAIQSFRPFVADTQQSGILTVQSASQRPLGAQPFTNRANRQSFSVESGENSVELSKIFRGTEKNPIGERYQIVKPTEDGSGAFISEFKQGRSSTVTPKNQNLNPPAKVDIGPTLKQTEASISKAEKPRLTELFTDEQGNRFFLREYAIRVKRVAKGGKRFNIESLKKIIGDKPVSNEALSKLGSNFGDSQTIFAREFVKQGPDGMFSVIKVDNELALAQGRVGIESPFQRVFVRTGESTPQIKPFNSEEVITRGSPPGRFVMEADGSISKTTFSNPAYQEALQKAQVKKGTFTPEEVASAKILDLSVVKPLPSNLASPNIRQAPIQDLPTMVGGSGKVGSAFAGKTFIVPNTFELDSQGVAKQFAEPKTIISTSTKDLSGFKQTSFSNQTLDSGLILDLDKKAINTFQSPFTISSVVPRTRQEQSPVQTSALVQSPLLKQEPLTQPEPFPPLKSSFRNPNLFLNPPPIKPPITPTKDFPKRNNNTKNLLLRSVKRKQILAIAQIRRRGKFLNVGGPTNPELALRIGVAEARRTLARTVRLVGAPGVSTSEIKIQNKPSVDIFRAPYGKKAQPLTFVEKKPFALKGSPGAVREIIASRNRGIFKLK